MSYARWMVGAVVVLAFAGVSGVLGQEPRETLSLFMRAKLGHSQKILEALTTEDFDQIAKHSQEISLLSQAEAWQVFQTPEYLQQSVEFRRSADALTDAAKKKSLDGAALAYVDMTLKCVNCHKYVRKVKTAALERPLRERILAAFSR